VDVWEGRVIFRYPTAGGALEHLLKSGAGTVFYDAIDPARRQEMERGFVEELESRHARRKAGAGFTVIHDYVACIARRP
jgi:hypothetical protein